MRNDGRSEFQMIGMNTIETNTIFQLAKSTSNMPTTKLIRLLCWMLYNRVIK